jgi:hypothetical protein
MTRGPTISSAVPKTCRLSSTTPSSDVYPGSRVRWRAGTHRIGRNLLVGVRGHRVRWLACARAS